MQTATVIQTQFVADTYWLFSQLAHSTIHIYNNNSFYNSSSLKHILYPMQTNTNPKSKPFTPNRQSHIDAIKDASSFSPKNPN